MDRLVSRSHSPRSGRVQRMLLALIGAACLVGALALAGCGVTTTTTGVGGGGPTNSGSANSGAPGTPGSGATGGDIHGTTVRPCMGSSSAAPAKTPTIVLTVKNSHQTTQAHVGDVIEIQLPAKMTWNAPFVQNGTLTPLQPQGGMDEQSQTCRWVYQAHAKGALTLTYTGVFRCESGVACPAIAEDEEFTIQIG